MKFYNLILSCAVLCTALPKYLSAQNSCQTPDAILGTCLPILKCDSIISAIEDVVQPLSVEARSYLRKFECGKDENGVKVCCPNKQLSNRILQYQPTSVENHKNVALLPNYEDCGTIPLGVNYVINGQPASLFEFPWMVLLNYKHKESGYERFRCGGTIINERYILTAAHCVTHLADYELLNVRIGGYDTSSKQDCLILRDMRYGCPPSPQNVEIEKSIPHEKYDSVTYSFDIALIRLKTALDLSTGSKLKAVCLPINDTYLTYSDYGSLATVTGWGITESGRASTDLRKVLLPTISGEDCSEIYGKKASIGHRHLCAGGRDGKDACQGDSGGPLHVILPVDRVPKYIEMGVVSFGPRPCGDDDFPGVYTFIPYYMSWILNHIEP